MESTFGGAYCSSTRAGFFAEVFVVVYVVALLVGRALVSTMFFPLEATLKHLLAAEMSPLMVVMRALLV